jgi:hypothetical protein
VITLTAALGCLCVTLAVCALGGIQYGDEP